MGIDNHLCHHLFPSHQHRPGAIVARIQHLLTWHRPWRSCIPPQLQFLSWRTAVGAERSILFVGELLALLEHLVRVRGPGLRRESGAETSATVGPSGVTAEEPARQRSE